VGFRFRWCKEARKEFEAAKKRADGSVLKGTILYVLEKLRAGQLLELARTDLPIRPAPVSVESQWSILYSGDDGDYVGLLLIQCAVEKLPASAYDLAQERLANLQF
jgi:hypothetical protein